MSDKSTNAAIDNAIRFANDDPSEKTIVALFSVIWDRCSAGGHFLVPVIPEEDGNDKFTYCSVRSGEKTCVICFTNESEANIKDVPELRSIAIKEFFETVKQISNINGIVINPFGNSMWLPIPESFYMLESIKEHQTSSKSEVKNGNSEALSEPTPPELFAFQGNTLPSLDEIAKQKSALLDMAVHFAVDHHAGQFRKGTDIPYILHPIEVMNTLRTMNADIPLLIAGVLHDTVEDTDATLEEISELFGGEVSALVASNSEDKSKSWDERKQHTINELSGAPLSVKKLILADKISNLRSIVKDYTNLGDVLWPRFNAPKEKQSWYYSGIQDALYDMQFDPDTADVYWEMVRLYKDVFVTFYQSHPIPGSYEDYLLQVSAHGEAFRLNKGNIQWQAFDASELDDTECHEIPREEAEAIEDAWAAPFWACIERDLADKEISFYRSKNRFISLMIKTGRFELSGEDFGPACRAVNSKDEYEYHVSCDEENTKRLLVQLRIEYGIESSFKELFKCAFGEAKSSGNLMEFCSEYQIQYEFSSY